MLIQTFTHQYSPRVPNCLVYSRCCDKAYFFFFLTIIGILSLLQPMTYETVNIKIRIDCAVDGAMERVLQAQHLQHCSHSQYAARVCPSELETIYENVSRSDCRRHHRSLLRKFPSSTYIFTQIILGLIRASWHEDCHVREYHNITEHYPTNIDTELLMRCRTWTGSWSTASQKKISLTGDCLKK